MTLRGWLALLLVLLPAASHAAGGNQAPPPQYCFTAPHDVLCSSFPADQTEFSKFFVYSTVEKSAQDPFDQFSWQAFIALNWPADGQGRALPGPLNADPSIPRVWESYATKAELLGQQQAPCGGEGLVLQQFRQADGSVLIDQAGNFVLYETRMNGVAQSYAVKEGLGTLAGQQGFWQSGAAISFPRKGTPSVLVKTAWRPVATLKDAERYALRRAVVHVPAEDSATGAALCLPMMVGLVGMHIVSRTESGNGDEWLWSTFEHVDNVPLAANARDINSLFTDDLFPGGCAAPRQVDRRDYAFFDPACPYCAANLPPEGRFSWAAEAPYALADGAPVKHAPQILRCWKVFDSTMAMNARWQAKLNGQIWANYQLISTQWRGGPVTPIFEHGEVPRYLSNTTLESYIQTAKEGSCMGCHAGAVTAIGQPSNFTFLFRDAR